MHQMLRNHVDYDKNVIILTHMTLLRRHLPYLQLLSFSALLIGPGMAIREGAIPFNLRFHILLIIAALCILSCYFAGYTWKELGLTTYVKREHWQRTALLTILLCAPLLAESLAFERIQQQPNWVTFAPFYIFISSPIQEIVCRSIPKLITDNLNLSSTCYIIFSSTIFSLMHIGYADSVLMLNTFIVGLVWSSLYLVTRSIWPLSISHATIGTLAFSLGVS